VFVQDENLNFLEIENKKVSDIIKDKFVIAFDFDGVVTNPHELKARYINDLGYNIAPTQCERHVCVDILKIPLEDYEKGSIMGYTASPDKLQLENGFKENFSRIKNLKKTSLFFVTSRYNNTINHMQNYMKYYKIKVDGIIYTENKTKTESLNLINAQIFTEDSPKKLEKILLEDPLFYEKCNLILYRNIANKIELNPDENSILEVDNWRNLADTIIKKYHKFSKTFSNSSLDISI